MPLRVFTIIAVWTALACAVANSNAQSNPVRTITFRPLDPIEDSFIFQHLGTQEIPEEHSRFQDRTAYIVYRFAFEPGTSASLSMKLANQFQVDLSSDGKRFDTVAVYTKQKGDPLRLDLSTYTKGSGF